jgi:hypothetical protein
MRNLLLFLLLAAPALAATGPFDVQLEAVPATTLPGIPVTLRITVTNRGTEPAPLPEHAILLFTTTAGETYPAGWYGNRLYASLREWRDTPVPARASVILEARATGSAIEPGWFDDPRLNQPGRFQLQVQMGTFPGDLLVAPEGGTKSTTAILQVNEPTGDDALIWGEMLRVGNGRWTAGVAACDDGGRLAQRVVTEYPHSAYAGWFATSGVSRDPAISAVALRAWLSQASQDEYTEWRQLRLAIYEEYAARYRGSNSSDEARQHVRAARALLEALIKSARNQAVAAKATEQLADVSELEQPRH